MIFVAVAALAVTALAVAGPVMAQNLVIRIKVPGLEGLNAPTGDEGGGSQLGGGNPALPDMYLQSFQEAGATVTGQFVFPQELIDDPDLSMFAMRNAWIDETMEGGFDPLGDGETLGVFGVPYTLRREGRVVHLEGTVPVGLARDQLMFMIVLVDENFEPGAYHFGMMEYPAMLDLTPSGSISADGFGHGAAVLINPTDGVIGVVSDRGDGTDPGVLHRFCLEDGPCGSRGDALAVQTLGLPIDGPLMPVAEENQPASSSLLLVPASAADSGRGAVLIVDGASTTTLTSPASLPGHGFGGVVTAAPDGTRIAVASPGADEGAGAIDIFTRASGTSSFGTRIRVELEGPGSGAACGHALTFLGTADRIAIGCPGANEILIASAPGWTLEQRIAAPAGHVQLGRALTGAEDAFVAGLLDPTAGGAAIGYHDDGSGFAEVEIMPAPFGHADYGAWFAPMAYEEDPTVEISIPFVTSDGDHFVYGILGTLDFFGETVIDMIPGSYYQAPAAIENWGRSSGSWHDHTLITGSQYVRAYHVSPGTPP